MQLQSQCCLPAYVQTLLSCESDGGKEGYDLWLAGLVTLELCHWHERE